MKLLIVAAFVSLVSLSIPVYAQRGGCPTNNSGTTISPGNFTIPQTASNTSLSNPYLQAYLLQLSYQQQAQQAYLQQQYLQYAQRQSAMAMQQEEQRQRQIDERRQRRAEDRAHREAKTNARKKGGETRLAEKK